MPISNNQSAVLEPSDAPEAAHSGTRASAPFAESHTGRSVFQLTNSLAGFGLLWAAMFASLNTSYWLTLLLAVPAAGFVVRIFIVQHDAGHGSFFKSRKANDRVGFFLGILTLTPYTYWKKTHAIHHATSGNLDHRGYGDVNTKTVKEYLALSRWGRFLYRVYRNPLILFGIGPTWHFGVNHRFPSNTPRTWKGEWASIHGTNLALLAIVGGLGLLLGFKEFLMVQLPITMIASSAGAWLFYVQHQYENTYWERDGRWDYYEAAMKGSSFYVLPKLLQWFTGNIGIHHIHHLNSRIPNYRLQECLDSVPAFQNGIRLTILESLKTIPLTLWDEDRKKLVGFRSVRGQPHAV
jgi:omega-6 fatty acid desaturase (delta-12 desaturase)